MNNLKQDVSINKNRSYTACISEAHKMLFDNIKLVFRHTWAYTAICALAVALWLSVLRTALYEPDSVSPVLTIISSIFIFGAMVFYHARALMLINRQTMKQTVIKYLKLSLCYIVFCAVMNILTGFIIFKMSGGTLLIPLNIMPKVLAVCAAIMIIMAVALLPYAYVVMKYMIEPNAKLRKLILGSYMTGLRHWGFIFVCLLLTSLCVVVCSVLVLLPVFITMAANTLSIVGVKYMGDPSGLPSYFGIMQFAVNAFSSFIFLYINIFVIFVTYFMYGSIETREREKKERASQISEQQ